MSAETISGYAPQEVIEAVNTAIPDYLTSSYTSDYLPEQQITENVNFTPMFLPGPEERALATDWSLYPTAMHEGKHAFTLYKLGYGNNINYITVIPNGSILGEVSISGHIPMSDFATTAAASSSTLFGDNPSGTFMDRLQIAASGNDFGSSLSKSESILQEENSDVMKRMFEIIAFMGKVSGAQFPDILAQAKYEVEMESFGEKSNIQGRYIKIEEPLRNLKQETRIIHVSPDHFRGVWLENGEVIAEIDIFKCPNCGLFHNGECPVYVSDWPADNDYQPDQKTIIPIYEESI